MSMNEGARLLPRVRFNPHTFRGCPRDSPLDDNLDATQSASFDYERGFNSAVSGCDDWLAAAIRVSRRIRTGAAHRRRRAGEPCYAATSTCSDRAR